MRALLQSVTDKERQETTYTKGRNHQQRELMEGTGGATRRCMLGETKEGKQLS